MNKKLSIAEVKRRLPVGKTYTAEFIGNVNRNLGKEMLVTKREIVKQTSEMGSLLLDGPKQGEIIYLNWKNTAAEENDNAIILSMTETSPPQPFLKIWFE